MKKLKMTFHGKDFYARLLTEEAPKTVAAIEAAEVFESRVGYAKLANREFFFQTPVFIDEEENPTYSQKGHVIFYGPRQSICVFYDDLIPLGYSNQFAVIEDEEQLKSLLKEADTIWEKQGDIETMLQFNRETGRNFVVVLYLNGFLDNMTILLYDYYLRAKQKEGDFEALKSLTAGQLRDIGNSFKSDYHMYDSHTLLLRAACEAYEVKNFEELTELLQTVQQYLVRLFYWADLCMPWKEMCEAYDKVTGK